MKYLTVAAAVWMIVGSALTSLAQTQGAGAPFSAPSAIASSAPPPGAAVPTPTATTTAPAAAADTPAALRPGDHAAWVATRPSGLRPGDHVLIIRRASAVTNAAPPAIGAIPQSAPRPEARQTPAAAAIAQGRPSPAPAAQPQPIAVRTPSTASIAANPAPAPTPMPKLGLADHVLLVSIHPPGSPGAASATDHAFRPYSDHQYTGVLTPGRQLMASLHLPPEHHVTEGQELLMDTPDDSCIDPMSWSVIVHKSAYLVDVFYKGKHFDSFPAVFGRNPDHSAKEWEGDLRTPEGTYIIIEKYYNPRWKWFLRLNYPNYQDRTRYESMLSEGLVPVIHGHERHLGGAIGIHGSDRPRFNRLHVNWTLGCISVDNDSIEELEQILPVGTLVIIKP